MERYSIRIVGHMTARRAAALDCGVELLPGGDSIVTFDAVDQTALYGLLSRLRDAGVELVEVNRARMGGAKTSPCMPRKGNLMTHAAPQEIADVRWRGLFACAGAAALLTALFLPLQILVFIAWPPPTDSSVAAWFAMFQANPLHGLVSLDLFMMIEQVLAVAIVVGLYVTIHRASESLMAVATVGWLVGATLFVASNTAFQALSLSYGWAASTTDAERATFLAAGQGMLTSYWDHGTAFLFGYVLTSIAGVLVGLAMLRSRTFGTLPAYAAISSNVLALGLFLPVIGIALSLVSVVVLWFWYALIGVRFMRFARAMSPTPTMTAVSRMPLQPTGGSQAAAE